MGNELRNSTKIYTILSILLLVGIFVLHLFFPSVRGKNIAGLEDINTVTHFNPAVSYGLFFIAFFYGIVVLLFLLYGIANFFIFIYGFLNKKPFFTLIRPRPTVNLDNNKASEVVFSVIYMYSVIYLLSIIVFSYIRNGYSLSIMVNLIFELFIIFIITQSIPLFSLGIKFSEKDLWGVLKVYSLTQIFIILVSSLMIKIQRNFNFSFSPQEAVYLVLILKNRLLLFIFIVQIIFVAPVAEELFFRGFMYNFLRKKIGYKASVIVTSFIFSFLHNSIWGFLPIFILSVGICYIYEKTSSITSSIVLHSLHNLFSLFAILLFRSFMQAGQFI